MKKVTVGQLFIQDNQDRRFGADLQYYAVWLNPAQGGMEVPLLFTKEELDAGISRAMINQEDVPELDSDAPVNEFDAE